MTKIEIICIIMTLGLLADCHQTVGYIGTFLVRWEKNNAYVVQGTTFVCLSVIS